MAGRWRPARRLLGAATAAALVSGFLTGDARAQTNTGKASFSMGTDFSHAYFFRGIRQERSGAIAQPYMDVTFSLFEGTEGLNSVAFTIGQWNSLHTGPTGNDGPATNVAAWYESDFYSGFSFGVDNWDFGLNYTAYLSPNNAFGTVKEVALSFAVDDSTLLGGFALSPHVLMAIELSGQADGGQSEGVYLELGVEPGVSLQGTPVSLSFPLSVGLSMSNYYEGTPGTNDAFGYVDLGLLASTSVPIPESYGAWEVSGGVHLMRLGDALTVFNDGDEFQAVGIFGLNIGY